MEFKGGINCIGDNMENYISFSVSIKKECDSGKIITYNLKFIGSFRFISTLEFLIVYNVNHA